MMDPLQSVASFTDLAQEVVMKFLSIAMPTLALISIGCATMQSVSAQSVETWPKFRGPDGSGVLEKLEHPTTWNSEKNIAWSVPIEGGGLSSPIVVGDKVFLTTAIGFQPPVSFMEGVRDMAPKKPDNDLDFNVICLSLTDGSKQWEKTLATKKPEHGIHASNSFATETPASDGEHVFAYFAAIGEIAAMDQSGKVVWQKNIGAYPTGNGFGSGSSVTTGAGKVFIQCDNDESSFVVALDAKSGEEAWRKERAGRTSWATPLFWENEIRSELVTCGSGFVTSYDPNTGEVLWKLTGIGMSFSASPAVDKERIYFGNSGPRSSGPLVAIAAGIQGEHEFSANANIEHMDWSVMQAGPGMSSPVSTGGYVYIPGRGKLTCYSASDGSVAFKERIKLGSMAASMWAAGDRAFLMDETGKTIVLEVGPEMKVVGTNEIADDLFWSTPSVAGKSLLIRGAKKLYCIRE
jgi:outer membrane protein assembly factor BamB